MTQFKKYLPAFICGFGAGVLQVVPVAKSFSCCLIIPIAAYLSIILDMKANGYQDELPTRKGVVLGLMTGFYAAIFGSFFELFITFVTKNNDIIAAYSELSKMINSFPVTEDVKQQVLQMLSTVYDEIQSYGFSLLYTTSIVINNFFVNIIFGLLGGLIGIKIVNSRIRKVK